MSLRDASIADVVRVALDAKAADLRVSMPGEIVSFDDATQLAEVRPLLRESHEGEDGAEITEELPVIPNVPVHMYGAGDLVLTFPVAAGDPCLLVFTDRSLDLWLERGSVVDPIDVRRHDLTDAVALVGVRAKPAALSGFDTDAAALRHTDGTGVYVRSGRVDLGVKNASYAVALAEKVNSRLTHLETAFNAHMHPTAALGPPSPPTPVPGAIPVENVAGSGVVGSVASSAVKVDG